MKIRISQIKNEIQREKVMSNQQGAASPSSSTCQGCQLCVCVFREPPKEPKRWSV